MEKPDTQSRKFKKTLKKCKRFLSQKPARAPAVIKTRLEAK